MAKRVRPLLAAGVLRLIGHEPHPKLSLDDEKCEAFEALAARSVDVAEGSWIAYDLPWPKYEFLQWLRTHRDVVFHGTVREDIQSLKAIRMSRDTTAFGDQIAVYASDDPIWAMYFAVLRKATIRWTKNSCARVVGDGKDRLPRYAFSVNEDGLSPDTFGPGVLYVLPKAPFRAEVPEFGVIDPCHWVSRDEVEPLAKLRVEPDDFPFLVSVFTTPGRTGQIRNAIAHWRSRLSRRRG